MFITVPARPVEAGMPQEPNIARRITTSVGGGATVVSRIAAWSLTKARAGVQPGMNSDSGRALRTWRTSRPTTRMGGCHHDSLPSASPTWDQSMSPTMRCTTVRASTVITTAAPSRRPRREERTVGMPTRSGIPPPLAAPRTRP